MTLIGETTALSMRQVSECTSFEESYDEASLHKLRLMAGIALRFCESDEPAKFRSKFEYSFLQGFLPNNERMDSATIHGAMLSAFASRGYSVVTHNPAFFYSAANRNVILPRLEAGHQQATHEVRSALNDSDPARAAYELTHAGYAVFTGVGANSSVFVGNMYHDVRDLARDGSPEHTYRLYLAGMNVVHAVRRQVQ